ncbi:glycine betaine ABC transporter substrate-binding protein [Leucobacter denitrificans]|uniref:Glycine betaine ABC transporter substrate-binding protein n=1 Tax=Leucobacter denitrificans TaxID=683042 RepID=A0A7G9S5R6_9MICO|nr:glycine betaine ABC transporter substrate-binding protein [Leucobacter denitrificans]QNN63191.1 glycine betaine ABC transporter substrate-binding protein [Leucobacter denitrificans]
MTLRKLSSGLAAAAAAALVLSGCATASAGESATEEPIKLGYLPAWTDGLSLAYLLEDQLGKLGYETEMEELSEASLLYTALSEGDVDIYTSAAPERTHASYMEKYGDQIEDLATYFDHGVNTLAVPEYMDDVTSIDDLAGMSGELDGRIVGIEPSAGLTEQVQDIVMPEYGLDDEYELVTSSTQAMLAELQSKIDSQEPVVVTLWRPFWANAAFPVKELDDPLGAFGDPEGYHVLGTLGFSERYPDAADYIAGIKLDDDAYGALEGLVTGDKFEGDPAGAVDAWIADHAEAYPGILTD